jgi:hypothetical protein
MALPVRSLGTTSRMRASVSAIIAAAPIPWAARAAIRIHRLDAKPQASDATVNRPMPASSRRRLPSRSPSRPAPTISAVVARRYARTTHWTSWRGAEKEAARVGNATFAMLVPRDGSSIASASAASVH